MTERLLEVVADELVGLAALVEPVGEPLVQLRPLCLAAATGVGDVADEHVVEAEAAPASACTNPFSSSSGRSSTPAAERLDVRSLEQPPDDGRALEHPALLRREQVEAGRDQRLDRRRHGVELPASLA